MLQQGFSTDVYPGVFPASGRKSQVSHPLEEDSKHGKECMSCEIPKPRLERCCFNQLLTEKKSRKFIIKGKKSPRAELKDDFSFFS